MSAAAEGPVQLGALGDEERHNRILALFGGAHERGGTEVVDGSDVGVARQEQSDRIGVSACGSSDERGLASCAWGVDVGASVEKSTRSRGIAGARRFDERAGGRWPIRLGFFAVAKCAQSFRDGRWYGLLRRRSLRHEGGEVCRERLLQSVVSSANQYRLALHRIIVEVEQARRVGGGEIRDEVVSPLHDAAQRRALIQLAEQRATRARRAAVLHRGHQRAPFHDRPGQLQQIEHGRQYIGQSGASRTTLGAIPGATMIKGM